MNYRKSRLCARQESWAVRENENVKTGLKLRNKFVNYLLAIHSLAFYYVRVDCIKGEEIWIYRYY